MQHVLRKKHDYIAEVSNPYLPVNWRQYSVCIDNIRGETRWLIVRNFEFYSRDVAIDLQTPFLFKDLTKWQTMQQ